MKNNIINYSDMLNALFQKVMMSDIDSKGLKTYDKLCQWFNNELELELQERENVL